MTTSPKVSALIVAFGDEPELDLCLAAVLASSGVEVDLVVVDNGDRSGHLRTLESDARARVIRPATNLGFAGGCNLAAEHAVGDVLVLVNPDVIVAPDTLAELAEACSPAAVGIATASVRLAAHPGIINSAGNPVHYLGLAWAGGHGDPADQHASRTTVASASGACCAIRAARWRELGGFDEAYFAYHEDVELSLRCWQRGWSVVYVPSAIAYHHYDFSRHDLKSYLLERNRLLTVITTYSAWTLFWLAIPLLVQEIAMLAVAAIGGWFPAKLKGYLWIATHFGHVRSRRQLVQSERVRSDRDLAGLFAITLDAGNVETGTGIRIANRLSAVGGRVFRRLAA
jgi:GT2 family glycosyltransferase